MIRVGVHRGDERQLTSSEAYDELWVAWSSVTDEPSERALRAVRRPVVWPDRRLSWRRRARRRRSPSGSARKMEPHELLGHPRSGAVGARGGAASSTSSQPRDEDEKSPSPEDEPSPPHLHRRQPCSSPTLPAARGGSPSIRLLCTARSASCVRSDAAHRGRPGGDARPGDGVVRGGAGAVSCVVPPWWGRSSADADDGDRRRVGAGPQAGPPSERRPSRRPCSVEVSTNESVTDRD